VPPRCRCDLEYVWVFNQAGRYLRHHRGTWTPGKVPLARKQNVYFDQAVAFGPSDVWVFGLRFVGPVSRVDLRPYAARFNGHRWLTVVSAGRENRKARVAHRGGPRCQSRSPRDRSSWLRR
jgi:hypothetical protein